MKYISLKHVIAAAAVATAVTGAYAQSAIDAYTLNTTQLRGSARFVSMGGAFTSLGGDISTMTQNPAGIGMFRNSDIGTGFSISIRNNEAVTESGSYSNRQTKGIYDYFGYVGAQRLKGAMKTFNWGFSYNRLASFDRRFDGYNRPTSSSLSNYIASFTQGVNSSDMLFNDNTNYNPYLDSNCDWLSILAYNSMMINNAGTSTSYAGLYTNGTQGDADYVVRETGSVDEYDIEFGGNVSDLVYWGLGVGIIDMNFTSTNIYSESMADALVYAQNGDNLSKGNAGFGLTNYKNMSGTGANLKFGLIVRPIEMLRVGIAVHTPTWMHMNTSGYGEVDYNYTPQGFTRSISGNEYTDNFDYNWRLNTPWRFMIGASFVLGSKAIVSVDYERVAYNDMTVKYGEWGAWGQSFVADQRVNDAVKEMCKASDIIRAGVEYRITPRISARAGINYVSSNVRNAALENRLSINTAGTDPSYVLNKDTYNICLGLGYRYKAWYVDLAYQHTNTKSKYSAYTPFEAVTDTPSASITTNHNNIVISTGFKF